MLYTFIIYLAIVFWSFYIYIKVLNIKNISNLKWLTFVLSSILISVLSVAVISLSIDFSSIIILIMLFLSCIAIRIIFRTAWGLCATALVISFGISFAIKLVSSIPASLINITLQYVLHISHEILLYLILFAVHSILTILLFKIKRFKNGFPFLYKNDSRYIGMIFCFFIFLFFIIAGDSRERYSVIAESMIVLAFISLLLFIWWKESLTSLYVERQRSKELDYTHSIIKEKDEYIQKLKNDNDNMSEMIHRDNKLIPSMEKAVRSFIVAGIQDTAGIEAKGYSILEQLEELAKERSGILPDHQSDSKALPKTDIFLIDTMSEYMLHRAESNGIVFDMEVLGNPSLLTEIYIPERDLCTVFADLIENSMIAVSFAETKKILVQFETAHELDIVSISDSGISFDADTLYLLGKKRATTHAEQGGSGIGMMSLFEITKNVKASLVIREYEPNTNIYNKTISIIFDGRNEYRIFSFRSALLRSNCKRADIIWG